MFMSVLNFTTIKSFLKQNLAEKFKSKIFFFKRRASPFPVGNLKPEKKAVLALADGTTIVGYGFGATGKTSGEVVFNTGMVGYVESITDPSYNGQILVQTYPLIGNYGVCPEHFESGGPKIRGYVVRELCVEPSHWTSKKTLDEWLKENGVPAIYGVDTRMLTKKLRIFGVMLGVLHVYPPGEEPNLEEIKEEIKYVPDPNQTDLAKEVSTRKIVRYETDGKYRVVLVDCGVKKSIIRNLLARKVNVVQVPIDTPTDKILSEKPDGIVLSNGPGNPKMVPYLIKTVKQLLEVKIPVFGICLGCQVLALALGGDTYKLKFGHRGQNHPAIDLKTQRCYITSQNHGYAINPDSLPEDVEVTFLNANDKTVEGIKHKKLPFTAVQFHPEAAPGPVDTDFLFDLFLRDMEKFRGG